MRHGKFLYMAVTGDEYELPIVVAETAREISESLGVDIHNVYNSLRGQRDGKTERAKIRYRRIALEDAE